jgi:glutathione S-transferase
MLVVHHLGVSQSDRIIWLCEELALPYELIRYERDPVTQLAPPEYRALHPFGTAPVITDDGLVMGESGAIIDYIIAKYGHGRLAVAADHADFANYIFWFHFANGSVMPSSMIDLVVNIIGDHAPSVVLTAVLERSNRAFAMIETRLGHSKYLAGGQFTAADIIMHFPLTTMRVFTPRDLSSYPNIRAYLQRIGTRPAYQRAMAISEPTFRPPLV